MKNLICILFLIVSFQGVSQNFSAKKLKKIDSLNTVIANPLSHDTSLAGAYVGLSEILYKIDVDTLKYLCGKAKIITEAGLDDKPSNLVKQTLLGYLADALHNLGYVNSYQGNFPKALEYYHESMEIIKKLGDKKRLASSLNNIGSIYSAEGDISKALDYYEKSLKIREELGDKKGVGLLLNNIAFIYKDQGDIPTALEYHYKALKIREEQGSMSGVAMSLNSIGSIYEKQGDILKALEYYNKALKINEEKGNRKSTANCLNNIGLVYKTQGDTSMALDYLHRSLKIYEEIGYEKGVALMLNNIGSIYKTKGDINKALDYYNQSLAIREKVGDKRGVAGSLINIGAIHLDEGHVEKARQYGVHSMVIAKEIRIPSIIKKAADLLRKVYEKQNKGMQALEMNKLFIVMRDSINNEATQKASAQQDAKYKYEKQKAVDDAEHDKQKAIDATEHDKLLAIEHEENEKQQILTIATAGGLGLVVMFLLFVFNRLQVTKKQKQVIEEQKQEVENQKEEVEMAHHELAEKNQEILDSINYAKRIQNAILPPSKLVKEYLQESFILYKPKDIVAGDFYWMEHVPKVIESKTKQSAHKEQIASDSSNLRNDGSIELSRSVVLFAAADCTGHGVPGAMVSVVCNNALNRSVREYGLTIPGEILDKTREIVIQEFEKSEDEVKDGMDIALCSLCFDVSLSGVEDKSKGVEQKTVAKLQYAGAHNPLWIIRPVTSSVRNAMENVSRSEQELTDSRYEQSSTRTDSQYEIIETKANKQPIGKFENQAPYTTHTFDLKEGDTIYIFSDGYVDQFGGDRGKKFKAKAFRELLLSIQDKSMEEQRVLIDESFEKWKGDLEQIDDVCIIGVKV